MSARREQSWSPTLVLAPTEKPGVFAYGPGIVGQF